MVFAVIRAGNGLPIGRKAIEIKLEKYSYTPGETIKGNVELKLKKPMKARKLTVALNGIRIIRSSGIAVVGYPISRSSSRTSNDTILTIYNFEIPLDGDNTYFSELYQFEIKIPPDILQSAQQMPQTPPGEGLLVDLVKTAQAMSQANSRVEWYVEARLDIPLNIDVCSSQKIVIS